MSKLRLVLRLMALSILAAGCSALPDSITIDLGNGNQNVYAIVQATFQSMTATAGASGTTPTPANAAGSMAGSLSYRGESQPAMYVSAFEMGTHNYKYGVTAEGSRTTRLTAWRQGITRSLPIPLAVRHFRPAYLAGTRTRCSAASASPVMTTLSSACLLPRGRW